MKTTMLYSLLFLTLLGVGIGCKKEVEEVKPPVVVGLPDYNCPGLHGDRVVKIIYKQEDTQVFAGSPPEQMMINGRLVTLNKQRDTSYGYDLNGKLKSEYNVYSDSALDTTRYSYTISHFIRHYKYYFDKKLVREKRDSVELDANGFPLKTFDGDNTLYDKDGYLLKVSNNYNKSVEVKEGNIIKRVSSALEGNGNIILTYDYDSTIVVASNPFLGYINKNLLLKETISQDGPSPYPIGSVYVKTQKYVFDKQKKVTKKIEYGERTNIGFWPYTTYPNVTEYYYNCL